MKEVNMEVVRLCRRSCQLRVLVWTLAMMSIQTSCESAAPLPARDLAEIVPLVRIIATPELYDGRIVTTAGVVGFEDALLYMSREDATLGVTMNGVRLLFSGPLKEESAGVMHGKYVFVEGRFRLRQGHSTEMDAGSIADITDLVSEDYWGPQRE